MVLRSFVFAEVDFPFSLFGSFGGWLLIVCGLGLLVIALKLCSALFGYLLQLGARLIIALRYVLIVVGIVGALLHTEIAHAIIQFAGLS